MAIMSGCWSPVSRARSVLRLVAFAALSLEVFAARRHRSCRQVFRSEPSCCLMADSPDARDRCSASRMNRRSGRRDRLCLCHSVCEQLDNCCFDYRRMCPPAERRLQAWCPKKYLSFAHSLLRQRGLPSGKAPAPRRTLWEKHAKKGRLPWKDLKFNYHTLGHQVTAPQRSSNDAEEIAAAYGKNSQEEEGFFRQNAVIGDVEYAFYSSEARRLIEKNCSGTVIGPRHILTSAHCLFSRENFAWHDRVTFRLFIVNSHGERVKLRLPWEKAFVPQLFKLLGFAETDYALIVLRDSLEQWIAFGARQSLPQTLWAAKRVDSSTKLHGERCRMDQRFLSNNPTFSHNCTRAKVPNGSPFTVEQEPQQEITNSLLRLMPHREMVVGIKTGLGRRTGIQFNLCSFHTICGWLNSLENGSNEVSVRRKLFSESLGGQCREMHSFIPSLIYRHKDEHAG